MINNDIIKWSKIIDILTSKYFLLKYLKILWIIILGFYFGNFGNVGDVGGSGDVGDSSVVWSCQGNWGPWDCWDRWDYWGDLGYWDCLGSVVIEIIEVIEVNNPNLQLKYWFLIYLPVLFLITFCKSLF